MVGPKEPKAPGSFRARLISGALWAVAGKSLSACGSFVAFLIVANSISNDETSAFVFCESAAIVGALLATGGLHSVIVRVLRNWRHNFPRQLILSFGRRITAIYLGLFFVVALAAIPKVPRAIVLAPFAGDVRATEGATAVLTLMEIGVDIVEIGVPTNRELRQ